MNIAVWSLPKDKSADSQIDFSDRYEHYKLFVTNKLNNGTIVFPNLETAKFIFQSYDNFGLTLVISSGSYRIKDKELNIV